ncbi:CHASE2 domain-containing protein [Nostoc sp. FACHB-152]|uniref:CHASE2 domain-containing protein n=1 Tax=unclassified Nostoc TaxID=2593658 RepID=UPI0016892726|nr:MULTISPECIES: CHASE2 domain-containing protein [unclassified Nostoc]MBD2447116.1 CHASE2 domain-containing protein [Nostoc sp. FACHB-152]MBD2469206.1 CHASE2 domain-containing protein [Nostoc sp. FACHB-145]
MISGILQKLRTALAQDKNYRDSFPNIRWWQIVMLTSVGVTALVWGIRELGELQSWELKAYDKMLRSRPAQALDQRILLVTITEEDIARFQWPLSDDIINRLLTKLESYQPRVIGLNIYRPEQQNLAAGIANKNNIITACLLSSRGRQEITPPNFPIDNVGFTDLISDNQSDQIIRRGLLFADPIDSNKCATHFSFAALVAINYLEKQGINIDFSDNNNFQIGKIYFPILTANSGSYQGLDAAGYQILINYRHPNNLAQKVTLTQVLNGQLNPNLFKDRLVIIGTTAASVHPGVYTPYSADPKQPVRTSTVFIHAQVASQILSTVLDGRPLIWYWPNWAELVWVWSWALLGSILGWKIRHPVLLLVLDGVILAGLLGICVGLFLLAGWIPLIPPALALVFSSVGLVVYATYQTQQQTKLIILQVEQQQEAIAQLNLLLNNTAAPTQFSTIRDQNLPPAPTISQPEKRTGDLLLGGRYQISRVLGSGGFGRTYLARDTQRPGNPICVVKQLMPARRDTKFLEVARRLFNTEAEILEALGKHPQIPALLAYFEDQQEFYLVQEYISGHTLHEELPPVQGVKNESFVIEMLKGVLEVLAFVHEHRVIHRDIKPNNIIRSNQDNRLVLIDFGAVKLMQPQTSEQTELATVAIGTRGYAPPEQFAGHPRLSSDIYALGMIAIQAITGIQPQELQPDPETGNVMWRHRVQINEELAVILDKMVRYHFSDRYQSAAAVLQDLNQISDI